MTRRVLIIILIAVSIYWYASLVKQSRANSPVFASASASKSFVGSFIKPELKNYPVVSGGVNIAKILKMQKEGYYADVDASTLHAVIVSKDFDAYVQYRRGGKVYWTKHAQVVRKNTLLFCDNAGHCVKADCGNEISLIPQEPNEPFEPFDTALDTPIFDEPLPPPSTGSPVPPDLPPSTGLPPTSQPPTVGGGPCCGSVIPPPKTTVPEPRTDVLLIAGLFAVVILSKRKERGL